MRAGNGHEYASVSRTYASVAHSTGRAFHAAITGFCRATSLWMLGYPR